MKRLAGLALTSLLVLAGCQPATVGVRDPGDVPVGSAATCKSLCERIGLPLESVVIMAENVGCVCGAGGTAAQAGTSGGMAAIMLQEEAAQQQQQRQRRAAQPR
jgi:hypothetical protein